MPIRKVNVELEMTLFISYKTKCLSCNKDLERAFADTFVTYKKESHGFNICEDCRKFQIHIDINEIIKQRGK